MTIRILKGDCRDVLRSLDAESVQTVITSPPYWGLRDYGIPASIWGGDPECEHEWGDHIAVNATNHTTKARWNHTRNGRDELQPVEKRVSWLRTEVKQGQFCQHCGAWAGALGLEPSYQLYVEHAVEVFREVRRILRPDGTLWLNLGDSYCSGGRATWAVGANNNKGQDVLDNQARPAQPADLKPKDLIGIPWRVAFALQADGWWLRQDIIWSKPNPMPESVTDRCTKAHEYLFLLTKSERYYFDADAIAEAVTQSTIDRLSQPTLGEQHGSDRVPGKTNGPMKAVGKLRLSDSTNDSFVPGATPHSGLHRAGTPRVGSSRKELRSDIESRHRSSIPGGQSMQAEPTGTRNRRSVWTVATQPFSEAHFATFPPALIEPAILAGSARGAVVLDPFGGAGTTGLVADRLGREAVLIELNPEYADMAKRRIEGDAGMFANVASA